MASNDIFEKESVSSAIIKLAIPTIVSSLVTVIYNLADTYFVGLLNDPVQTAAVTLAAPALLAFNAINNLFGVGTSSAMSRALGRGDSNLVRRCSVFGLYCAFISSVLFSVFTGSAARTSRRISKKCGGDLRIYEMGSYLRSRPLHPQCCICFSREV